MKDTNAVGAKSEGAIIAALLKAGKTVLLPFGVHSYDIVFEDDEKFYRVQCKTGRMRNGAMLFDAYSKTGPGRQVRQLYTGKIDFFGVFCPYNGECYLIPIEDVPGSLGWFRIDSPRNSQAKGIKFAAPYLIHKGL